MFVYVGESQVFMAGSGSGLVDVLGTRDFLRRVRRINRTQITLSIILEAKGCFSSGVEGCQSNNSSKSFSEVKFRRLMSRPFLAMKMLQRERICRSLVFEADESC